MADLRAALGRGGMTSTEAKAWVEELDRLGEGLDQDNLRKAAHDSVRNDDIVECFFFLSMALLCGVVACWLLCLLQPASAEVRVRKYLVGSS